MKKLPILAVVLLIPLLGLVFGRFGSTDPETAKNSLHWIVAWSAFAILVFPRRRTVLPISKLGLLIVTLILGYGWLMAINAKAEYNIQIFDFEEPSFRFWESGPGSLTQGASIEKMIEVSGLFLVFFAAVRARDSGIWKSLLGTIPVLGALITVVGLFHRVLDARAVWFIDQRHPETFFAPYVYNANAGSVLNFAGAIAFSFWVSSFWKGSRSKTIGWAVMTAMCFLGAIATASKGTFLILGATLAFSVFFHRKRLFEYLPELWSQVKTGGLEAKMIAASLGVLIAGFSAVGVQKLIVRFDQFLEDAQDGSASTVEGRLGIMRVMMKMARVDEGGWSGFGPGSFQYIVPYFTVGDGYDIDGRWINGHSDPLQLFVEWGHVGGSFWILFGLGALIGGFRTVKSTKDSETRTLMRGMIIALILLSLHSCFDFPYCILSIKFLAVFACGLMWSNRSTWQNKKLQPK